MAEAKVILQAASNQRAGGATQQVVSLRKGKSRHGKKPSPPERKASK